MKEFKLRYQPCKNSYTLILLLLIILLSTMPIKMIAQKFEGKELVVPSLLVPTVDTDKPFTVGIQFRIRPQWHLYWKNPGDAGLAIEVEWNLPKGYTAGEIQFPTPKKIQWADEVVYGYERVVLLLCEITPPAINPSKQLSIHANLDWLVCKESCLRGSKTLELNIADLSEAQMNKNHSIFLQEKNKLPQSIDINVLSIKQAEYISKEISHHTTDEIRIQFEGTKRKEVSDFFPEVLNDFVVDHSKIQTTSGNTIIPVTPTDQSKRMTQIHGLVIINRKGYSISAPVIYRNTAPD